MGARDVVFYLVVSYGVAAALLFTRAWANGGLCR